VRFAPDRPPGSPLRPSRPHVKVALLLGALLAACADGAEADARCTLDAECVSGVCRADGTCAAPTLDGGLDSSDADANTDDGSTAPDALRDPAGEAEAGPAPAETGADAPSPDGACRPNHDGVVTRAELPLAAGFEASFRSTTDVTGFRTEPACEASGCVWDLVTVDGVTAERAYDTLPLAGRWFGDEPAFAGATYVAELGELAVTWFFFDVCRQRQLGVFRLTDDALLLLGVVSEREADGTLLVYDPPVPVLRLPLALGATWTLETRARGPLCNSLFDYAIDQTLTAEVDAVGDVVTPYGRFADVLRVNTLLERHLGIGVLPTTVRTHAFVTECFSTVATIRSAEGVDTAEFDDVAEVRRLAAFP
jgi:hypothetical protein